MSKKFLVSLGYSANFVFDDRDAAMRFYMAATEGTPVTTVYLADRDERFAGVDYVRNEGLEVSLLMKDESAFCTHMTAEEFKAAAENKTWADLDPATP